MFDLARMRAALPARVVSSIDSWLDRGLDAWDRVLASERFHRWAMAFPPTRWLARRHARALFDIVAGFAYSQTLYACVELKLFDLLAERPHTPEELADLLGLRPEPTRRLLKAAASLDLTAPRSGGRYGLGTLGAAMRGAPGVAEMVAHHRMFYADLADPVALLRDGPRASRLSGYWPYALRSDDTAIESPDVGPYTELMSASQRMVAAEILDAYSFSQHKRLLDVGGGAGAFARQVAAACSHLDITVCDLPPVADLARKQVIAGDFAARIAVRDCDFRTQPLPEGADIISLLRVLHDHDDDVAAALLRAVWRALPDNGTILVAEPMAQVRGAERMGDAYFGLYLLAMGSGRPRSEREVMAMLADAGFVQARRAPVRNPLVANVIVAAKPPTT